MISLPSDKLLNKAEKLMNNLDPSKLDAAINSIRLLVIGIIMKVRVAKRQ